MDATIIAMNDLTRAVMGGMKGYEVTARELAELDSYLGAFARRIIERNGASKHENLSKQ